MYQNQHLTFALASLAFCLLAITAGCNENTDQKVNAKKEEAATTSLQNQQTITASSHVSAAPAPNSVVANTAVTDDLLLTTLVKNNKAAYIPAQCYTKTKITDEHGQSEIHNPCYSCHTTPKSPNYIDDASLQLVYQMRTYTRTNRWSNLFKDRTDEVAEISDSEIINYVRQSNYFNSEGNNPLTAKLANLPANWDFNQDGKWNGYQPDCYFNIDDQGFDINPKGQDTGWRAFAYTPFLGTFWPTNGSTDDTLIRLPPGMRQNDQGHYSREVYSLNFAIVEAMIKRKNISINATNEALYGVDLNRNGSLDTATEVVYLWNPRANQNMSYVGKAKQLLAGNKLHIAGGLYPEGTEFLHTVRYIDVDAQGNIKLAARLKELRYSVKKAWNTYNQLNNASLSEVKEADQRPDRLRTIKGNSEEGLLNGLGWTYQGFIEDKNGDLRPQSYEETLSCVGCHSGVGITTDSSFTFARKLDHKAPQQGWSHAGQYGLAGLAEPQWRDGTWEYTEYLKQNGSGNEFRNNDEVFDKFFNADGSLKETNIQALHADIGELVLPSPARALMLNKAYKVIVDEQSFIYGRDAHVKPLTTVWQQVPEDEPTGVIELVVAP